MATAPGRTRPARRERGGLENDVLATLASAGVPLKPAEVRARLGGQLAYTTVMTTLVRLEHKGVITRARMGRAFAYRIVDAPTICARRMCQVLDSAESREVVLARFLDELDPADVPVLQRLLDRPADV